MSNFIELSPDISFLVVDTSSTMREGVMQCLKKMGFLKVFQAMDGMSAIELLKRETVGFIICDRYLDKMSGMEFLKELRETPELGRAPFMMMAGEIPKEDILFAAEFGIDGYLKKPFVLKDVSVRIAACVERFNSPNSSEAKFENARILYLKGSYEEALTCYTEMLGQMPQSARAKVGKARCERALGREEEAEKTLLESIEVNSMYVHAHHELGLIYLQRKDIEKAKTCFAKAIELSPQNPIRYEAIADILMRNQQFEQAEEYLTKAVKLELAYPVLFEQLGKALFAQKKLERAYRYFEKALAIQPNNVSFLNSMGICMKEQGKFEEALKFYNQALKFRSDDTKVLFNKVLCLIQLNEYDRARKICLQILTISPNYEKAKKKIEEIDALEKKAKPVSSPPAKAC